MTEATASLADAPFAQDARLVRLLAALNGEGEETRVIGGAVRDAVMRRPIGDVDLASTATPETVTARARAAGFKTAPTGFEHGTVTVIVDGKPFEVTTLREDIETDGRHAKVRFGRDFARDAMRRDFTINALSVGTDGRVHDYAGGLADAAAGRVRFIGEARQRIREDYLRILRLYRFHASHGLGALDAEAAAAAISEREGLATLSRERIRAELMKLVVAPRAAEAAQDMSDAGLLQLLIAGVATPARLARLAAIEPARGDRPDAVLRLAALAVSTPEDADRLRERLRLSNAEAKRLERAANAMARLHRRDTPPGGGVLREMLFLHGREAARDALLLAHAAAGAAPDDAAWMGAGRFLQDTPQPRLPFSGADLLARGVPADRTMGATLKRLQAAWIRAGFPSEPATLARLLDQAADANEG